MASIDIVEEILRHSDDEIIEYLDGEMADVAKGYSVSLRDNDPTKVLAVASKVGHIKSVLKALNRRNQERKLQ